MTIEKCSGKHQTFTLTYYTQSLEDSFRRWDHLFTYGGSDPGFTDGVNLNLVRNHIIYYKKQMEAFVARENLEPTLFPVEFPEIYSRQTPEEVPNSYMARADEIRARAKEQIALYEKDPNFQYILTHHEKAFCTLKPIHLEDRMIYPGRTSGFDRYRDCIEQDDLVAMRKNFHVPYEEKAPQWAEWARELKEYLSMAIRESEILPLSSKIHSASTRATDHQNTSASHREEDILIR